MMKELGEGSRDMTVTMTGWDLNPRILGIVPKNYKVHAVQEHDLGQRRALHGDSEGRSAGKARRRARSDGVSADAGAQALTYDKGYFYPGPAVKNVPLSMAPKESQDVIKEFGRPEYEGWLAQFPHVPTLDAKAVVEAFRQLGQRSRRAEDEVRRNWPQADRCG